MSLEAKKRKTSAKQGLPARKPGRRAVTPEERRQMIADLAYNKSESRGSRPGDAMQDWLDAEAEIDARLAGKGGNGRAVRRPARKGSS